MLFLQTHIINKSITHKNKEVLTRLISYVEKLFYIFKNYVFLLLKSFVVVVKKEKSLYENQNSIKHLSTNKVEKYVLVNQNSFA